MTADFVSAKPTPDLAFISQHLFTAILWVNDELSITWLNAQAEQLLAISSGRLLNQSILTLLAPDELTLKESYLINNSDGDEQIRPLTERFNQAQHYQQPFIDHDHLINTPLNGHSPLSVDYSVTPVVYQQRSYFIIEMWGKDRQSRISEEQRQQQQYSVARHMLRSVAHEIKNPLAGIRGAAQLLQRQFIKFSDTSIVNSKPSTLNSNFPAVTNNVNSVLNPLSNANNDLQKHAAKLRNYTDIIISETDRLTQLVGQLLGSNQLPNWQTLNIHEPLEHVLALIIHQYPQVALQRDYDLSLPELFADKDQLIQVFLNLINNACESMTEFEQVLQQNTSTELSRLPSNITHLNTNGNYGSYQPKLHIQTRVVFQHTIGGQQHKQVLQVTITDNGSGIDPTLIGQIFFPMVTSRATGTGLGLSIVQDIISRHHGMIDVSSNQSQNSNYSRQNNQKNYHNNTNSQTCFTLYLPFRQPIIEA